MTQTWTFRIGAAVAAALALVTATAASATAAGPPVAEPISFHAEFDIPECERFLPPVATSAPTFAYTDCAWTAPGDAWLPIEDGSWGSGQGLEGTFTGETNGSFNFMSGVGHDYGTMSLDFAGWTQCDGGRFKGSWVETYTVDEGGFHASAHVNARSSDGCRLLLDWTGTGDGAPLLFDYEGSVIFRG